jgi:hypothetical protein
LLSQIISVGDDKMSKKKIPVPEPEEEGYICPYASWGDITGLIPFAAGDSVQLSSYDEGCPYLSEYGGDKDENIKSCGE